MVHFLATSKLLVHDSLFWSSKLPVSLAFYKPSNRGVFIQEDNPLILCIARVGSIPPGESSVGASLVIRRQAAKSLGTSETFTSMYCLIMQLEVCSSVISRLAQ